MWYQLLDKLVLFLKSKDYLEYYCCETYFAFVVCMCNIRFVITLLNIDKPAAQAIEEFAPAVRAARTEDELNQ
jgi:hypothetical protein